jgi:hypothetical protein
MFALMTASLVCADQKLDLEVVRNVPSLCSRYSGPGAKLGTPPKGWRRSEGKAILYGGLAVPGSLIAFLSSSQGPL